MLYYHKIKLTILILFFVLSSVFGQHNKDNFVRIGTEQGLTPGNVNDILQDSLGFLWFGTESGLCRYDGYTFKIFQNELGDSNSLSFDNIFSLLLDEAGIIWIGTLGGGLNRFDTKTETFKRYDKIKNSLSYNTIFKVYKDSENRIWISTLGGGLNLFNKDTEQFIVYKNVPDNLNSISSNTVSSIYEDNKKRLWVGTFDGGLNLFNPKTNSFTHFKNDKNNKMSINHNQIMDIIACGDDSLMIATFGGGINIFDIKRKKFFNSENEKDFFYSTEHKNVRKFYKENDNIWVGTYNGLYKFNTKRKSKKRYIYEQNNLASLSNNKIREIFKDKSNNIWIGTINGANKLNLNKKKFDFVKYDDKDLIKSGNLVELANYIKSSSLIWGEKVNKKIKYFNNNYSVSKKQLYYSNSYFDDKGRLWIGNYNGLKYFNKNNKEFKYVEYVSHGSSEVLNNLVKSFYIDKNGDLWAGTLGGGLTYYDMQRNISKNFIHSEEDRYSISDSRVFPIYEDSYNNFWVGTYGGLNRFVKEQEKFIKYIYDPSNETSLSNDRIYSIFEAEDRTLWIGTYQGLNKYIKDKDNFERITVKEGLLDNTIYCILEDERNNLWLRTGKGISKYNPQKKIIRNYTIEDGIDAIEANGSICFKDKNGKMFFGGLNGFNTFYPKDIKNNNDAPKIVFTDLKIFDKSINISKENDYLNQSLNEINELELSYKDKIFTIQFSALNFTIPSKTNYAYKLKGFNDNWKYIGSEEREVTFTNLNSGKYVLHVKATNNDGVWSDKSRKLIIIISPPYWQTWWFRLLIAGFIMAIIFIFYEVKLSKLLEIEKTRAKIARNLHDDVGGTLASIQYFVNAIKQSKDQKNTEKFLDLIVESSNDVQEKVRDIIWTVNPKEDGLSKFMVKFNRYASDIFDSNGINYKINFPKIETEKKISMEKRQHFWFICKETVINTVKHSKCDNVKVDFILTGNKLEYIIYDDGIGCKKNNKNKGYGLKNIEFRAGKINADYKFEPNFPQGMKTTVLFELS
ncbi:MAG: hypothetical protein CR986_06080 [Ignavibacteriae bacterium]|nr:MAG: hypothetical protein CR986_06080 [Ignavibacteriota bacterium]